jgi:predicted nuclease of predicted toxin-antitoxin system
VTILLLDANLSPKSRAYLVQTFGFDVIDLITEGKAGLTDEQVVAWARSEGRVIVTFDLDFGEIYHFREPEDVGVIILRLDNQTVESVNSALDRFFRGVGTEVDLDRSLVIVDDHRVRIVGGRSGT